MEKKQKLDRDPKEIIKLDSENQSLKKEIGVLKTKLRLSSDSFEEEKQLRDKISKLLDSSFEKNEELQNVVLDMISKSEHKERNLKFLSIFLFCTCLIAFGFIIYSHNNPYGIEFLQGGKIK